MHAKAKAESDKLEPGDVLCRNEHCVALLPMPSGQVLMPGSLQELLAILIGSGIIESGGELRARVDLVGTDLWLWLRPAGASDT